MSHTFTDADVNAPFYVISDRLNFYTQLGFDRISRQKLPWLLKIFSFGRKNVFQLDRFISVDSD
ncbi:MAG: hypothetical protein ACRC2R_07145 [Xenococcaceae cyanobacterium]